jgi:hypothetical protein
MVNGDNSVETDMALIAHYLRKIVGMGKNGGRGEGVPLAPGTAPLSDDARLVAEEAARYAKLALDIIE